MFSTHICRTFIRRPYILNVSGCGLGKDSCPTRRCNSTRKMFSNCVFQPKKYISSLDYDNKKIDTNYQFNRQNNENANNNNHKYYTNNIDYNEELNQPCTEYEEAIKALNTLQSNAQSLRSSLSYKKRLNSLEGTRKYLKRSGLSSQDLASLSYIHVSGSKGKGSTCALTESILRSYGVKTGFYSSPHLVYLTERIRINGWPITKQKFAQYFWPVYNKLLAQQEYENDMPPYFMFLTILCFHTYLAEKVDVVILEVGIGGELDCTNIVPNTKTVGISSLGLEHTELLGNSLKEIAWQKAGIIKPQSTVYTSVKQAECLEVINERAKEKNSIVYKVPDFDLYFQDAKFQVLKDQLNSVYLLNGSLAIQLAYDWLRQNRNGFRKDYSINEPQLTDLAIRGLQNCHWPGRCQVVKFFNFNMHLDGAHTIESMQLCGDWFSKVTASQSHKPKILIFNITGNRDSKTILNILRNFSSFDMVCFVPNISSTTSLNSLDTQSVLYSHVEQLKKVQMHCDDWRELCKERQESNNAKVFPSIIQCFQHIRQVYDKSLELNILVTGSIHLIGATILALDMLGNELAEK